MNVAFLCLGGNMGDRLAYLSDARRFIDGLCGKILLESSVYETASWGVEDLPGYYNQCIKIETLKGPLELLDCLLAVEKQLGRVRTDHRNESRTIDIDILLFNDEIINAEHCHVPHPRMHLRRFVLIPMNEIAAELKHPILKKTMAELLKECPDDLAVKKL